MEFTGVNFQNQQISDWETFKKLPADLQNFLKQANGLVAFHGGIQFKGCVVEPVWISLREIWTGNSNLFQTYPTILPTDVPFAQDGFGDQFIWRDEVIFKLETETGELTNLEMNFEHFLEKAVSNPVEFLNLQSFLELFANGIRLELGQLMNVFPPFVFATDEPRSFRPVPAIEQIEFLKTVFLQTQNLADGQFVNFQVQ